MAGSTGFEPATSGLTVQCANQAAPRARESRRYHAVSARSNLAQRDEVSSLLRGVHLTSAGSAATTLERRTRWILGGPSMRRSSRLERPPSTAASPAT